MQLYEICFEKAKDFLEMTNEETGEIFNKIQIGHSSIFKDFFDLIQHCSTADNDNELRQKLEENEKETQEVIAAANNLNDQFEKEASEKKKMKEEFEKEISILKR